MISHARDKSDASAQRSAWLRPKFSLRLLLLALTAFALGFPIWFRWPFKVVEVFSQPGAAPHEKRTTTWQRQWGNTKLKHGPETVDHPAGTVTTTFQTEQKHGPYTETDGRGKVRRQGQYVNDMKEGLWEQSFALGMQRAHWHQNRLDGECEIELQPGRTVKWQFAAGRLTQFEGQPVQSALLTKLNDGKVDQRSSAALKEIARLDTVQLPLDHTLNYLADVHMLPIAVDNALKPHVNVPVTVLWDGLDLASALTAIAIQLGIGCDYRYGTVWVTTRDDALEWHDPTGVADINPLGGTALAEQWLQPLNLSTYESPLDEVLDYVQDRTSVNFELRWSQSDQRHDLPKVTINLHDKQLKDALGIVLYNAGRRCKQEGQTLVILPPDDC